MSSISCLDARGKVGLAERLEAAMQAFLDSSASQEAIFSGSGYPEALDAAFQGISASEAAGQPFLEALRSLPSHVRARLRALFREKRHPILKELMPWKPVADCLRELHDADCALVHGMIGELRSREFDARPEMPTLTLDYLWTDTAKESPATLWSSFMRSSLSGCAEACLASPGKAAAIAAAAAAAADAAQAEHERRRRLEYLTCKYLCTAIEILWACTTHPQLASRYRDALAGLDCDDNFIGSARNAVLDLLAHGAPLDGDAWSEAFASTYKEWKTLPCEGLNRGGWGLRPFHGENAPTPSDAPEPITARIEAGFSCALAYRSEAERLGSALGAPEHTARPS